MIDADTYYSLLEVAEDASATEIRAAYYKLAKDYHPDTLPKEMRGGRVARDAEERFKQLQEAYSCLSNPDKRAKYDKQLAILRLEDAPDTQGTPDTASPPPARQPSAGPRPQSTPPPQPGPPTPSPQRNPQPSMLGLASLTIGAFLVVRILLEAGATTPNTPAVPAAPRELPQTYASSFGPSQVARCDPSPQPDILVGSPPTTDTYLGTVYHQSGSSHDETLGFGGWGDEYTVFIQFDISEGPPREDILDVRVCLFASGVPYQDPQLSIHRIVEPWHPSTLSTLRRPALLHIGVLGAMTHGWNQFDGTELYQFWQAWPDSNFGVALMPQNTFQTNGSFAASKHPDASLRPRLVFHLRPPPDAQEVVMQEPLTLDTSHVRDSIPWRDTSLQLNIAQGDAVASRSPNDSIASRAPATRTVLSASTLAEEGYQSYAAGRYQEARTLFEQAAAAGDAASAGYLGFMYMKGYGVPVDLDRARALFESSAAGGEPGAAYNLGDMYFDGLGVKRNRVEAQRWYRRAFPLYLKDASAGDLESIVMVGRMYLEGAGVASDGAEAESWLRRAAERSHARAQRILGMAFIDGFRVRRDRTEGIRLLTSAARNGDIPAQERLRSMSLTW